MALQPYFDIAFTPTVLELQTEKGSREMNAANHDRTVTNPQLGHAEIAHITARDSLYMATVSETGWPYVQHKGGDAGWIKVLGPTTIGWLERNGNKQYLGTGNLAANDRVALILVDYPNRTRLKLFGRATYHAQPAVDLLDALVEGDERHDGATTIEVEAVAWNCPKYLTPRFTQPEAQVAFDEHTAGLRARIAELEAGGRLAANRPRLTQGSLADTVGCTGINVGPMAFPLPQGISLRALPTHTPPGSRTGSTGPPPSTRFDPVFAVIGPVSSQQRPGRR